ncbi:MAG: Coenzyme F420 hydrogenase/dehydrogenase, beta subunit C-terminal domain [Clostridia bacterium]|nr:Coenzyme F420 hydrogenase/dehydrogenase, beta subunit C-terminal domain [Clostridia bacterium]
MVLFDNKANCCGCGACAAICPKGAIMLKEDEYGFRYPAINSEKCVECSACKRVCPLENGCEKAEPESAYVATNKNVSRQMKSASGGVFSAIAEKLLNDGWTVWGAAYDFDAEGFVCVKHESITATDELVRLQGSKYVQSNTDQVFKAIKDELKSGKRVLFSGTPCQVAAVKKFTGTLGENLVTIDVICHGVPSVKMLKDYFEMLGRKYNGVVKSFSFRDKTKGWGMTATAKIERAGKVKNVIIPSSNSSYFSSFLKSETYRESCYSCAFATKERVGDLTIGDYWGIQEAHPNITQKAEFSEERGISCILVNTEKGQAIMNICKAGMNLEVSVFDKVAKENHQLKAPSARPVNREKVLDIILKSGFDKLENVNKTETGKKYYVNYLKAMLPTKFKTFLKRLM